MEKNITALILNLLVQKKLLTNQQASILLSESQKTNKDLAQVLKSKNFISEEEFIKAQGEVLNILVIDLTDKQVQPEILNIIPEEIARTYNLVPFAKEENEVKVALSDVQDFKAVEALDFIARQKGLKFLYYLTSSTSLNYVLRQYANLSKEVSAALENVDLFEEDQDLLGMNEENTAKIVKSAPVSKTVSVILRHAIEGSASDIHIEPMHDHTRVRYRVDGVLHNSLMLPINLHPAIVARIKVLSNLKIDETRLPQDGRFKIKFEDRDVEFRVSTLPLLNREKVVMRILDTSQDSISLEALGFKDRNYDIIKRQLKNPHGMVLVTGPTGSGKSTTLYAMLSILNKEQVNIVTLEDPVEYNVAGVAQAQIRPEVGLTFASGLRSILRQDPDIVMVGEVRDKETAELVVHAALTGHMVLSTLHTNDAFGAIPRLMDMGIESFLISSSLNLVIAQRLVRKLCSKCKQMVMIPSNEEEQIFKELADVPARSLPLGLNLSRPLKFYKGTGCPHCESTGYKGRIAIAEMIEVTEPMRDIISSGKSSDYKIVKAEFLRQGLLTMRQDGIIKALRGYTSFEEVWNATKD